MASRRPSSEDRVDVQEPNPGRVAKRDEQRRQRRSVFMTALIGATVTAILAAAAAFRIGDRSAGGKVKIVTTTTVAPVTSTTDTDPDTTLTTLYVPQSDPPGTSKTSTTSAPAGTTTTGPTTTTMVTPVTPPPTTPPTNPGTPAVARVVWTLSPGGVTVQSGAQFSVTVTATNNGNGSGSVTVPACPAAPRAYSVAHTHSGSPASHDAPTLANTCHPGNQTLMIRPGQHYSWTDTISATSDATRFGTPLSAGNYLVLVNGSPVMFLRMTVSA